MAAGHPALVDAAASPSANFTAIGLRPHTPSRSTRRRAVPMADGRTARMNSRKARGA